MPAQDNSLRERILSACSGSVFTSLAVTPLDVVKVRMQSQGMAAGSRPSFPRNAPYVYCSELFDHVEPCVQRPQPLLRPKQITGTFSGFRYIVETEGLHNLWRGLLPALYCVPFPNTAVLTLVGSMMSVPATVTYFIGYEALKSRIRNLPVSLPVSTDMLAPLVAGSSARIIAATLISPLELLRTNMQHQGREGTIQSVMAQVFQASRKEGLGILWRGLIPTLWRDVPFSGIYWSGYELLKVRFSPYILSPRRRPFEEASLSFASGACSGAFAAIATTPFDVAKTRQQIDIIRKQQPVRCANAIRASSCTSILEEPAGMLQQLKEIWRDEGPKGWARGMGPRVFKVAPACGIMISSYELSKAIFREARQT